MLFFGWLLVVGACIEITRAVMAGHRAGLFYHSLAAILCGTAALLILARLRPNIKAVLGLGFPAVAMALSIFVPARTFDYWDLPRHLSRSIVPDHNLPHENDPALLQRRLRSGLMAEHSGGLLRSPYRDSKNRDQHSKQNERRFHSITPQHFIRMSSIMRLKVERNHLTAV
jgi:hypothetical protein